MKFRQWWWDTTHYTETFTATLTNNNGTYTSETLDIALKPGDQVMVRTHNYRSTRIPWRSLSFSTKSRGTEGSNECYRG